MTALFETSGPGSLQLRLGALLPPDMAARCPQPVSPAAVLHRVGNLLWCRNRDAAASSAVDGQHT